MSDINYVVMSMKEIQRLEVIEKVLSRQITRQEGARTLNVSYRHIQRLVDRYKLGGGPSLVSKRRGMPSSNRLSEKVVKQAVFLVGTKYSDFGPTFAHEKLTEIHRLKLSVESLRQLMIKHGFWKGKKKKGGIVHQMRERRSALGEMVQIDGSPHEWFEERGPKCTLLVFVDDATSNIMHLRFEEEETTEGYMEGTKHYIEAHGIPLAFYSDKYAVFRVNSKDPVSGTKETQFGRALKQLGIILIHANTPQAKGRVENLNGTLQDRLVKELRLKKIDDIATANAYCSEFIEDYNKRFGKAPACEEDAHKKTIPEPEVLDLILSERHTRTISKNLEVRYDNKVYQIQSKTPSYAMRRAKLNVYDKRGNVTLIYKGKVLKCKVYETGQKPAPIASGKELDGVLKKRKYESSSEHLWEKDLPKGSELRQ